MPKAEVNKLCCLWGANFVATSLDFLSMGGWTAAGGTYLAHPDVLANHNVTVFQQGLTGNPSDPAIKEGPVD